jgi:hypothetical protein
MTIVVTGRLYDDEPWPRSTGLRETIEQLVLLDFEGRNGTLEMFQVT